MESEFTRRSILKFAASTALAGLGSAAEVFGRSENEKSSLKENKMNQKYSLPELPYAYDALEPYYDQQTVRIHHDKHHQGYVNGLNKALEQLEQARKQNDFSQVKALSRDLAFNGSGHVLHTIFWNSMTPGGVEMPDELGKAMKDNFGSVDAAIGQFKQATITVEASGWGVFAYEPMGDRIVILQAERHQDLTIWGVKPLLVCDAWEHAYYLKFQNNRAEWVENFMKIANWNFMEQQLKAAKEQMQTA